jgi:FMN-dependent NADH-azoreductase
MATLLHIDVSPRGDHSVSRKLSAAFTEAWKAKNPDGKVIVRDLSETHLPFVDTQWIGGAYSPPEQHTPEQKAALKISDELIAELLEANEIVVGTPMYNFAIPARMKAWIDHIVRHGKTFSIGEKGYAGLAGGRKATFIVASGGVYLPGSPAAGYDLETPYLKAVFGFIGITDVQVVLGGGTTALAQGKVQESDFLKPLLEETKALA